MQIAIAGAGIMGRLLAFKLLNAGHQITLFDQAPATNKNCSFAAAGMLAPISELEKSDPIIYEMGRNSICQWREIISKLNNEIYFKENGSLVLSHPQDKGELKRFVEIIETKFTSCQLRMTSDLEPELTKFIEAYYFEEEAHLDNQTIMIELAKSLHENGVNWRDNITVDFAGLQKMKSEFDVIIDCRGLGAKDTFRELQGIRGELIWLHAPDVNLTRPIRLLHPRYSLYIVPRPGNIYLVGASEILAEDNSNISVRSTLELLTAVFYVHAGFAEARILKTVTASRPTLPHYLPHIKYHDGFIAINGLYRHGFLIAPTLAHEVLNYLENGRDSLQYPQIGDFS